MSLQIMKPEIHIGDKVKIVAEGQVIDYSNSHGLCFLVEFPMEDFTEPRRVWLNEDEVSKANEAPDLDYD